jgi:tripartite-type tricarboxylate transporter receptor subunit TctC
MFKTAWHMLLGAGLLAGLCAPAAAQSDYPTRPVRIVVPSTPGGGTDTFARLIAQHLSVALGQQFIVDNRPGGGTLIGMDAVAHAPPDGYTLYMSPSTTTTMHIVRKSMPYDVRRAFAPVTQVVMLPQALIIHPSVPAQTMQEFIALAKREPGKLTYGSAGMGTAPHMSMELLKSMAGIDIRHIPYRGVSQSLTDVLGGRISGMILNVLTSKPSVDAGLLRALGVTGLTRSEAMPNVPPISESGVPKYESLQWFGVLAPAGTPPAIVNLLQSKIAEGMKTPDMRARLATDGAEPVANTPAEFAALINDEIEKWTVVAKAANIQPEE